MVTRLWPMTKPQRPSRSSPPPSRSAARPSASSYDEGAPHVVTGESTTSITEMGRRSSCICPRCSAEESPPPPGDRAYRFPSSPGTIFCRSRSRSSSRSRCRWARDCVAVFPADASSSVAGSRNLIPSSPSSNSSSALSSRSRHSPQLSPFSSLRSRCSSPFDAENSSLLSSPSPGELLPTSAGPDANNPLKPPVHASRVYTVPSTPHTTSAPFNTAAHPADDGAPLSPFLREGLEAEASPCPP
mmetsp:Transcript_55308/g.165802  ORF Transcript_55308/g.165802 Transcript_55308/m.165802 type:complete len:244 (-) Transcript_55308:132-863(-)